MNKSTKVILACLGLAIVGGALFVGLKYFRGEPAPDDVPGWKAHERLEVTRNEVKEGTMTRLMILGIDFGGQFTLPHAEDRGKSDKDLTRLATTYYHRQGPLGVLLERFNWSEDFWRWPDNTYHADARLPASVIGLTLGDVQAGAPLLSALPQCWSEPPIAVVGILGSGVIGAYLRPYQFFDVYEPSPAVIELSLPKKGNPEFTYLKDAQERGANVRVFQGRARTTLAEQGPDGFYRIMVIEPSRINDRPTVDLLSREAMDLFLRKGSEDVVVAYHTSNRHFDLPGALAAAASDAGYASRRGHYTVNFGHDPRERTYRYTSEWLMVCRNPKDLLPQLREPVFLHEGAIKTYRQLLEEERGRGLRHDIEPMWSHVAARRFVVRDAEPGILDNYRRGSRREDD